MTKEKFIGTCCEFRLIEDDWNDGEGKTVSIWNSNIGTGDSIESILKNVLYLNKNFFANPDNVLLDKDSKQVFHCDECNENDFSRFDADLQVDINQDSGEICKPTEERWEKFKNGEIKLYVLHIYIRINKIVDLDENDKKTWMN